MISPKIIKEIDAIIKETWLKNIQKDYSNLYLLKEDGLKCSFYYHLRRKLAKLLKEYNLRIYPEFYFAQLGYYADIAIVQIDLESEQNHLKNMVTDVIAVIELKYAGGNSKATEEWIKSDIPKIKNYIQGGKVTCQFYAAFVYETECSYLKLLDKRSANNWASGYVTELNAGYLDGKMTFEVNSYNGMNSEYNS